MQLAALLACPDCPSALAGRALVFSESFWTNVWFATLPFAATLLIVRWVARRVDGGRDA